MPTVANRSLGPVLNFHRGLSLIAMMGLHTLVWWTSNGKDGDVSLTSFDYQLWLKLLFIGFGWLSVAFAFTAGISFSHWFTKNPPLWHLLLRCALLAGLGVILNPDSWYIFQFLALASFVSYFLLKFFKPISIGILILCTTFLGSSIRAALPANSSSLLRAIWVGTDNSKYFWPFFPWYSLFGVGILWYRFYSQLHKQNAAIFHLGASAFSILLINGALYSGNGLPSLDFNQLWGPGLFQPSVLQLFLVLGASVLSLEALFLLRTELTRLWLRWIATLGSFSFFLYYIHYRYLSDFVFMLRRFNGNYYILAVILQIVTCALIAQLASLFVARAKTREGKLAYDPPPSL